MCVYLVSGNYHFLIKYCLGFPHTEYGIGPIIAKSRLLIHVHFVQCCEAGPFLTGSGFFFDGSGSGSRLWH